MIELKHTVNLNLFMCEEALCEDESTHIWASPESRVVDLCDFHYSEAIKP
jgi:hypothetical protein